jgi:hypothetical protein
MAAAGLILFAGCAAEQTPRPAGANLEALVEAVGEVPGWSVAEGPIVFDPASLYEYMNGGADRFLSNGFRRLLHLRYRLGDDPYAAVALDLYDMGSELGAFGIYSAGRRPGIQMMPWGAEGYRDGTIACAYRGRVYMHGSADDDRPELIAMLESILERASSAARGPATPPAALDPLPASGRIPGSERYVPAELLGHSFLPGGVTATYEIDQQRSELYYCELGSAAEAVQAFSLLEETLGGVEDLKPGLIPDATGVRYTHSVLGSGTVVRRASYLAGMHGDLEAEAREHILSQAVSRLDR